jgi:hypothetical protein
MSGRAACTIIAKNYLAFARTLARSFQRFHPDYKFYVLIVDDSVTDESFETIKLADLGIPGVETLCFKYDVKELCTAVKADLLDYLLQEKSLDSVLYLDPDILVTANLDQLYERLETSDLVLTPHLDADFPVDGLLPDDGYILRAGQFNLGFIGVNASENARRFLSWWREKLHRNCYVDLLRGYFVDQKFIDFVPHFFENVFVERDCGYNVAYWNLHTRKVTQRNGEWRCNDGPLYFFHFSGYLPHASPDANMISNHIPLSLARHSLSSSGDLHDLFDDYAAELLGNGYRELIGEPYRFDSFTSGERISKEVRRYYRDHEDEFGASNPFESVKLKSLDLVDGDGSAESQLNAILNSRAWLWVSRYGRFKQKILNRKP